MVEAVAMRTWGLGGDSEVHVVDGLEGGLRLGPRRLMPISLAAQHYPDLIHATLDRGLAQDIPAADGGLFAIPLWDVMPLGLDAREQTVADRLADCPLRVGHAAQSRMENPALARLVGRGLVILAGVTPSDASHVLGLNDAWDAEAAEKALTLFARRRTGAGTPIAASSAALAQQIVDQLRAQTVDCLLQAGFAEDDLDWSDPARLAQHPLTKAGLSRHQGVVQMQMSLGVPVIGLGASAATYYVDVGKRLGTRMVLPAHGGVANAIGAVVGQVRMVATGTVTSAGEGAFAAHLPSGPQSFADHDSALAALETALRAEAETAVRASGVEEIRFTVAREVAQAEIENRTMFIEATLRVEASGRPRIARDAA
jgi:N-methylhydantoinase A/oxoprolinase/acetone carboxylase beta subunit